MIDFNDFIRGRGIIGTMTEGLLAESQRDYWQRVRGIIGTMTEGQQVLSWHRIQDTQIEGATGPQCMVLPYEHILPYPSLGKVGSGPEHWAVLLLHAPTGARDRGGSGRHGSSQYCSGKCRRRGGPGSFTTLILVTAPEPGP